MHNLKNSNISYFFLAPIISCLILLFYFQINPFSDLSKYYFQGDGMFVFFWIKNIASSNSFYCPKNLAYPILDTNCFRDFVLDHNYLQVMMYHIIAFFTKNYILIQLIYTYVTLIIVALITNLVLLKFYITRFLSFFISTFFTVALARIVFIHNFTMGFYFSLPLAFLALYWFYENKISFIKFINKKLTLSPNKYFFLLLIFGVFSIISSAYYAYMFLVILSFGLILNYCRYGKINLIFFNIIVILFIFVLIAFFICIENFIFNYKFGFNNIIGRGYKANFAYDISISSLLLPVENHFFEFLRKYNNFYQDMILIKTPEGINHQIGFFSFIGYCLILLFQMRILLAKNFNSNDPNFKFLGANFTKNRVDFLKFFGLVAILTFLYFSSGGFYRLTHLIYSQFRVVCRFNIIFTLLGLIFWGIYFDQLIEQQKHQKNRLILKILVSFIFVIAYLDAVGKPDKATKVIYAIIDDSVHEKPDATKKYFEINKALYENDKKFVEEIEKFLPKQSKIFVYPVFGFPEFVNDKYRSVAGYLHSNDLIFSYPMPKNRKSHLWQTEVAELEFNEFIAEIKKTGFNGVWIEKYYKQDQKEILDKINIMEKNLKKFGKKTIISDDKKLVFYEI